jgi:hypothetical protein
VEKIYTVIYIAQYKKCLGLYFVALRRRTLAGGGVGGGLLGHMDTIPVYFRPILWLDCPM